MYAKRAQADIIKTTTEVSCSLLKLENNPASKFVGNNHDGFLRSW